MKVCLFVWEKLGMGRSGIYYFSHSSSKVENTDTVVSEPDE